jgi:Mg-chelatase subunit ChlD
MHLNGPENGRNNPAADPNHANYEEQPYVSNGTGSQVELNIDPPLEPRGRRRSRDTRRAASPWRKQLIILMVDDSGSMQRFDKAKFATEAARELISRCYLKNPNMACFDVAIMGYGDFVFANDEHLLRPVTGFCQR